MAALKAAQVLRSRTGNRERSVPKAQDSPEAAQPPVATAELLKTEAISSDIDTDLAIVIDFAVAKSKILAKRYLSQGVLE